MRLFFKIVAGLLLLLFVAAAGILTILYRRGDLHRQVQSALSQILAETLNARIEIGRCDGSLLHTLEIESVRLFQEADTLAQIDTLRCHWQPISLIWGEITLDRIEVSGLRLSLHQFADRSWNYQRYFKTSSDSSRSPWILRLRSLQLRAAEVSLRSAAGGFPPLQIDIPSLAGAGRLSSRGWQVELADARLAFTPPGLTIPALEARARGGERFLELESLRLATPDSRLRGRLRAHLGHAPLFAADLRLDSLAATDLSLLTGWKPPFARARIELTASGRPDSISLDLRAGAQQGQLHLQGWVKPAGMAAGRLELTALETDSLLDLPGRLDADLTFSGAGFSTDHGRWQASGALSHSLLSRHGLGMVPLSATLAESLVTLQLESAGAAGSLQAAAALDLGAQPHYDLTLAAEGLDLAPLTAAPALASRLRLHLHLAGQGFDPSAAPAQLQLAAGSSTLAGFALDTLYAAGGATLGGVRLDTLRIAAPGLHGQGSGRWDWNGPLDLTCALQLKNHRSLAPLLGADSLRLNGLLQGRLAGPPDSLTFEATARLQDSRFNTLRFSEIHAALAGTRASRLKASLGLTAGAIAAGSALHADSLALHADYDGRQLAAQSRLVFNDSLRAAVALRADDQDSLWQVSLQRLELQQRDQLWHLEGPLPRLTLQPAGFRLADFSLVQGRQRLEMNGSLGLADSLAFRVDLENLDLAALAPWFPPIPGMTGAMTWRADLTGLAARPCIVSSLQVDDIQLAGLPATSLQVSGRLEEARLTWEGSLNQGPENSAHFGGMLPLRLRWPLPHPLIEDDDPVDLSLRTRDLKAGILAAFIPGLDISGTLSGDLTIGKNWGDPQPGGYLEWRNGAFLAPFLGKPYKPVTARLELAPPLLLLQNLRATGGEGQLNGEGSWRFTLDRGHLSFQEMQLRLKADHFTAAESPELTLVLDGTLTLTDQLTRPKLNGALRVERARIDLAAFTETPSTLFQADLPLLLVARGDTSRQSYDRKALLPAWLPVVERSRGSIKLEIPRNTWLRTPEMNIEISGDLDLAKEGEDFGLFGAIQIVRGNYDLFSRRFDIEEGTLTFAGGDNLPEMSLKAEHVFRSQDKIKHTLGFTATGELRKPTFAFTLDEATITESDAVSYLAFGRSFGDLTHGEKNDLVQNQLQMSGDAFKQLLAGQIAGEVTRSLQQKLDLDVIEFRGDQNWRQSTVVVGKYLTNDLYLSYERPINLGRTNEVAPEQVTLEYEIMRSLFLQAIRGDEKNTGFDLIYKWEK